MPGMGGSSFPPPSFSEPTFTAPTFETVYTCSGCGKRISQAESGGSKCPYCGISWGFKQEPDGTRTYNSAAVTNRAATVGFMVIVFVLLGGIVFVGLFIGIIVAVVKAATSSSPAPPQPQRYY